MPTVQLTLQVQPGTDVLHRVLCVCRRRNLQIVSLTYADSEIAITVSGDGRHVRRIDAWLAALVNVIAVERLEPIMDRSAGSLSLAAGI